MFLKEYEKLRELGTGAFAKVYKVRHNELGYIRAIRVLNEIVSDEKDRCYMKFLDECKILLRLGNGNHPNIVHIYQPRFLQNHALVEMDYVDGCDIDDYLKSKERFIDTSEAIQFLSNIGSALAYCHEDIYQYCMDKDVDDLHDNPNDGSKVLVDEDTRQRLIEKYSIKHNDIHSKNIMRRDYDGSYVLLDFGLAIQKGTVVKSSTRHGGAPEYKSPEKWENDGIITKSSDIYSFGIVLYEMLAGHAPFVYDKKISQQRAEYDLSEAHQKTPPPPIEPLRRATFEKNNPGHPYQKDYPDWLEEVIMKCLAKKPEDRYRNGKELYEEVKPLIANYSQANSVKLEQLSFANEKLSAELETEAKEKESLVTRIKLFENQQKDYNTKNVEVTNLKNIIIGLETQIKNELNNSEKQFKESEIIRLNRRVRELESKLTNELNNSDIQFKESEIIRLNRRVQELESNLKNELNNSEKQFKESEIIRLNRRIRELENRQPRIVEKNNNKTNPLWIVLTSIFAVMSVSLFLYFYNRPLPEDSRSYYEYKIEGLQQLIRWKDATISEMETINSNKPNQKAVSEKQKVMKDNVALKEKVKQLQEQLSSSNNSNSKLNSLLQENNLLKRDKSLLNSTINEKDKEIKALKSAINN